LRAPDPDGRADSEATAHDGDRRPRLEAVVAVPLCAFGAWLRLDALPGQVPFHDEWHALLAVARLSPAQISSSFGHADHSIPVTLYLEALSRLGRLDPLLLWGPFALAGLLTLLLLPVAVAGRFGARAAWLLAPLLALSPLLVYFSRTARPYVFTAPLALAAALALETWWRRPGRGAALRVALLCALVAWSLLAHLPFVGGAVLAAVLLRPAGSRRWRDGAPARAALALAIVTASAALLAWPLLHDLRNLDRKLGGEAIAAGDVVAGLLLFPGAGRWPILLVLLALACDGAVRVARRQPTLAILLGAGSATQLLAIATTRPDSFDAPLVAARYLMPVGLVVLVCAAAGAADRLSGRFARRVVAPAALVAFGLAVWAPARGVLGARPDGFRSTTLHRLFHFEPERLLEASRTLPAAYRPVRQAAGDFAVLEAPYNGYLHAPYGMYQWRHRREVYLGVEHGFCATADTREVPAAGTGGFALDRFVELGDLARLRALGIRFVLIHRDPEREIPLLEPTWDRVDRFDFDACVERLRALTGRRPRIRDGIAVFDLAPPGRDRGAGDRPGRRRRAAPQTSDSR
jgi:hypothetical protein